MRSDVQPAIDEFWSWWADHRDVLDAEVGTMADLSFGTALGERVAAIDPRLEWEFGQGLQARHQFCLAAAGDPELRVLAERWKASGPGPDAMFEFHTARQRIPGDVSQIELGLADASFAFADLRFELDVDEGRHCVGLQVHHPVFASVDERTRAQLMFVALDNVLGEDAVETWIGGLEVSTEPAGTEAVGVEELRAVVDGLPQRWTEPAWGMFQGAHPESGAPVLLVACTSARYLQAPLFDTLCLVRIPYESNEEGMPRDRALAASLSALDAQLEAELGDEVRILARQTGSGLRTVWCYVRAANGRARRAIDQAIGAFEGAAVHVSWDPGWRQLPV